MPYADKDKQKAYVREWSREYQRRKKAERLAMEQRLKELGERDREKTDEITAAFKQHTPLPDPRDEKIKELEQTIKEKNNELEIAQEIIRALRTLPKPEIAPEPLVRRNDGKTRS
jgi:signal recognition particle GTPase